MLLIVGDGGHDPVARLDQGEVDQVVGPDGAMGDDDIGWALLVVEPGDVVAQAVAAVMAP